MKTHSAVLVTIVLTLSLLAGACGDDVTGTTTTGATATTIAPTTTSETTTTTEPVTTTTAQTTTTMTIRPDPSEGWGRLDLDTGVFAPATIVDGATDGSVTVLAGCNLPRVGGLPLWWSDGGEFVRVDGPDSGGCIQQVEWTPIGWFAVDLPEALRSENGITWEPLALAEALGYEFNGQLGNVDAIFVSPDQERVTLLYQRAAEAESTVATLVTTSDGENWTELDGDSASLFDSSEISTVIEGGDGLLAGGSSPGGQFVPTAAVFSSPDGLDWRRVTPDPGDSDYDDKVISDIDRIGDRFIAVGGDFFRTGLMTAWASPDGLSWIRLPSPEETTDPSVAQMTAQAVSVAEGFVWASGRDFDARRSEGQQEQPALWRSIDGQSWERIDLDELGANVPFTVLSTPDRNVGVWPPPYSNIDEPLILFGAD